MPRLTITSPDNRTHLFLATNDFQNSIDIANQDGRLEVRGPIPRPNSTRNTWFGGTWYHAAVALGDGGYKIYVNGSLEGSSPSTHSILDQANILSFAGGITFPGEFFDGVMDEVSLYDRETISIRN